MYQVLYRKYRPRVFADVYGQDHVTSTLKNEIKEGRISHAYLFTGSRHRQDHLRQNLGQGGELPQRCGRRALQRMRDL